MKVRGALAVALVCACAAPAAAQWYRWPRTQAEARAAAHHRINKDLFDIDTLARDLERALAASPANLAEAGKLSGKIADLSRKVWKNLQGGKPNRPEPKLDPRPAPRSLAEAGAEAAALRSTLDEIRRGVAVQQRTLTVDAHLTVELVEKVERLELSARRIQIDAQR